MTLPFAALALGLNLESLRPPALFPLLPPLLLLGPSVQLVGLLLGLSAGIPGRTTVLVCSADGLFGLVDGGFRLRLELLPLGVSKVFGWLLREQLAGVSLIFSRICNFK